MSKRFDPAPRMLSAQQYLRVFGGIYEHSPWVAAGVLEAGLEQQHDSVDGLAQSMAAVVDAAGREAQLALLCAHPDLGGRAAIRGELSDDSSAEQASAGLDRCTEQQYAQLQQLNAEYRDRFGFPFILAVRDRTREEILTEMRRRLVNDTEREFAIALAQVHEIARLRLAAIAAGSGTSR